MQFKRESCKLIRVPKPQHQPIYWTIFQRNNFPRQYHALNTVFRLLPSFTKIWHILYKINFRYVPKSEAAVLRCSIKRLLKFFKKLQAYNLHLYFLKKDSCEFFSVNLTKYFRIPFYQNNSGRLLLLSVSLFVTLNLAFFWFTLDIFRTNPLGCLRISVFGNNRQLTVPELIHWWLSKQCVETMAGN